MKHSQQFILLDFEGHNIKITSTNDEHKDDLDEAVYDMLWKLSEYMNQLVKYDEPYAYNHAADWFDFILKYSERYL